MMMVLPRRRGGSLYGTNLAPTFADWEKTNASDTFVDNGDGTWTYTVAVAGQNRPGIQTVATVTSTTSPSGFFRVHFVISAANISNNLMRYNIITGGAATPSTAILPLSVNSDTLAAPSSGTRTFIIAIEKNPTDIGESFTIDTNAAIPEFRTVL